MREIDIIDSLLARARGKTGPLQEHLFYKIEYRYVEYVQHCYRSSSYQVSVTSSPALRIRYSNLKVFHRYRSPHVEYGKDR